MIETYEYEDIIHLPHHVSQTHPRMSIRDRAAQFSPFAALNGYDAVLQETARRTQSKRELDESEIAALDAKLQYLRAHLSESPRVTITYFQHDPHKTGGAYQTVSGVLQTIDLRMRMLILEGERYVPIDELSAIESSVFPDLL